VRQCRFAGGHVFTYSARPGTAAARIPEQVPHATRKRRGAQMRSALAESAQAYRSGFIGKVLSVLWESASPLDAQGWEMSGLTGNYIRLTASSPRSLWNQITPVHITGLSSDGMSGQIV
jgi:threonylcarbamoyladenosine tRNA methylthiotransferase MtaB